MGIKKAPMSGKESFFLTGSMHDHIFPRMEVVKLHVIYMYLKYCRSVIWALKQKKLHCFIKSWLATILNITLQSGETLKTKVVMCYFGGGFSFGWYEYLRNCILCGCENWHCDTLALWHCHSNPVMCYVPEYEMMLERKMKLCWGKTIKRNW